MTFSPHFACPKCTLYIFVTCGDAVIFPVGKYIFCHVADCVDPPAACSLTSGLLSPEPPSFVQRLEDMSCMVGSEISMKCMLSGSLPIIFSWIKDGHELTEDEHVKMSYDTKSAMLNLKNAQLSHGGKYVCQAQNKAGTQRCAAMVIVTGL